MLKFAGYINILIAIGHIVGLIWAKQLFEKSGIENEMNELAQIHWSLPYLITILVAVIFLIFGLYGLSASGKIRKLPLLKTGIFTIAIIYLFRGFGEIIVDTICYRNTVIELTYSLIAIFIGCLYLFGGMKLRESILLNR